MCGRRLSVSKSRQLSVRIEGDLLGEIELVRQKIHEEHGFRPSLGQLVRAALLEYLERETRDT